VDVTFSNYELSLNISGITIVVVCINCLERKVEERYCCFFFITNKNFIKKHEAPLSTCEVYTGKPKLAHNSPPNENHF
jgi:hypothetical protein